jgi:hypothetical protein
MKRVNGDMEHRLMWFEQGKAKPNWVVAAMFVPRKMQYVIELRKAAKGDVVLHMSDKLVAEDRHETRVWHKSGNTRVDDVYGKLWLSKPNLLKYKLHVRPRSWNDVIQTISNFGSSDMMKTMSDNNDVSVIADLFETLSNGRQSIRNQLKDHLEPMEEYWTEERRQISEDFGVPKLMEYFEEYIEIAVEIYGAQMDISQQMMREWVDSAGPMASNIRKGLSDTVDTIKETFTEWMSPFGDIYEAFVQVLKSVARQIKKWNRAISDFLNSNKFYQQLCEFLDDLAKKTVIGCVPLIWIR